MSRCILSRGVLLIAKPPDPAGGRDARGGKHFQRAGEERREASSAMLRWICLSVRQRPERGVIFSFTSMTNMVFSGLTVLNSCNWTCCFTGCESVEIRDLLLLGYRTFSDGVMLADCADVRVDGCFVRTGDDAMEVKSGSAGTVRTKNVVFENNAVWTDKGIAYGAVYESAFDQSDVVWRNNSVGYALADWSRHLGCVTVSMEGRDPTVRDHHLYFQDIEIYRSHCPVITVMMHNGGYIHDIYFQSIHAKGGGAQPGGVRQLHRSDHRQRRRRPADRFCAPGPVF